MRQFAALLFVCSVHAALECYFPFLEVGARCKKDVDCPTGGFCVHSVQMAKRTCCNPKSGTIQPVCPKGLKFSSMPLLCDATGTTSPICPSAHICVPSITNFTRADASPLSLCCKFA